MSRTPIRRVATAAAIVAAAVALAPTVDSAPAPLVPVGAGYFASNVELIGTIPTNADSAGARFDEESKRLYVTEDRGVTIYDVAEPTAPELLGFWPSPQWAYVSEEDVDTNGEILLVGMYEELGGFGPLDAVNVIDVSDPTAPIRIGQVQGVDEHTISCVWDCAWAWGSAGAVVDLRDPTNPVAAGNWWSGETGLRQQLLDLGLDVRQSSAHDVTEIAPGLVVTSTNPIAYVAVNPDDATQTTVLGIGELPDRRYIHGNVWDNDGLDADGFLAGADDLLLVGGETGSLGGSCGPNDGAFMVFDAAGATAADQTTATDPASFTLLDEWRVEGAGLYTDGNAPYNQFCAHWFTTHPDYDGGGLVAAAWYEHGTRVLDVDPDRDPADGGIIEEVAWFVPLGGSTSAAYWVADDIVYTTDYQRGIDILRIDPDGDGEITMIGDAPLVASRTVDPNAYFPWFGFEDDLAAAGRDAADDGWAFCQLPVTVAEVESIAGTGAVDVERLLGN